MKARIEDGILYLSAENKDEEKDLGYWVWLQDDSRVSQVIELESN